MSYLLTCPNCGVREVTDFGFGGEISPRPKERPSFRELNAYNYFKVNRAGVQREWWFHRSGCRAWFVAERDTTTNEVMFTALPGEAPPAAAQHSGAIQHAGDPHQHTGTYEQHTGAPDQNAGVTEQEGDAA
jgi:heterotetrameric sarcosine oxidase delta subunit